jgi:carboxymethylenebutenolidase
MNPQWIEVQAGDTSTYGAYLALPPLGKGPGIVLFQEIFGVNRHIRAVADQYAMDGFVVLAPDVFWRQAPRIELGYEGADREKALALMKGADAKQLADDVKTTVAALRARPELEGRVAAIGYCMGGRLAYAAAATAGVDAAVAFYGGGIQDQLERAASIRCPMQFHYGAKDHAIPMEAVEKVKAAFAGRQAEFHVYPDAGHGFNCWDRASYHAPSAALAHGRTLEFLAPRLF